MVGGWGITGAAGNLSRFREVYNTGAAGRPPNPADRHPHEGRRVTRELNVLALFKGQERFIFVYDDDSREAVVDEIRDRAADPATAINWFDAAVLTDRVRTQADAAERDRPSVF